MLESRAIKRACGSILCGGTKASEVTLNFMHVARNNTELKERKGKSG